MLALSAKSLPEPFSKIPSDLVLQALTLVLLGAIKPGRFVLYCIAHSLGAIAACGVLAGILPGPLTIACRLSNGTSVVQGFFIGMSLPC